MGVVVTDESKQMERINIYMDSELRQRVQRVGEMRGTSEAATMRWLLGKGLEWYEGLSRNEKEVA